MGDEVGEGGGKVEGEGGEREREAANLKIVRFSWRETKARTSLHWS